MEIDFNGLQEARKKGDEQYKNQIVPAAQKEAELKKECSQLKQLYVSFLNTKVKNHLELGRGLIDSFEPFHAKALEREYPFRSLIYLDQACKDEFNNTLYNEVETKLKVKHMFVPSYSPSFKTFGVSLICKYN
jgi:hypothetical protein